MILIVGIKRNNFIVVYFKTFKLEYKTIFQQITMSSKLHRKVTYSCYLLSFS